MSRRRAALVAALVAAGACRDPADAVAVQAVRDYDAALAVAFRTGDVAHAQAVAGEEELRRLGGLVGVKLDQGVNLDATLVELVPLRVERADGEVLVTTRERWDYRDRRIGTGEQVAEASRDEYVMRYRLRKAGKRWIVQETEFAEPPRVGRTQLPATDVSSMHGVELSPAAAPPGSAR